MTGKARGVARRPWRRVAYRDGRGPAWSAPGVWGRAATRPLGLLAGVLAVALLPAPAEVDATATITVDTSATEISDDNNCSLAEAIEAANTNTVVDGCAGGSATGVDVIDFATTDPITAPDDGFQIASNVKIEGHAAGTTISGGGGIDIVLGYWPSVDSVATDVTLKHLTVTGVDRNAIQIRDNADDDKIAGSYQVNLENLHVHDNRHVRNPQEGQPDSGAIRLFAAQEFSREGVVRVKNSLIENNTGMPGIDSDACDPDQKVSLVVTNSIIKGNGGAGVSHRCGHMKIVGSTIRGNSGGGVHADGGKTATDGAILGFTRTEIVNTTIAENTSTNGGGGVHVAAPQGFTPELSIVHSTITRNDGGTGGTGGISSRIIEDLHVEIVNTVVASNDGAQCDFAVAPSNNAGNASSDDSCDDFAHSLVEPDLQDLADNGGTVAGPAAVGPHGGHGNILTMAIPTTSPLFDKADANSCNRADTSKDSSGPKDARGVTRPQGAGCDIGAFEVRVADDITVNTTSGRADDGECSLEEAVKAADTDSEVEACTAGSGDDSIVIGVEGEINIPDDGLVLASDMSIQGYEGGQGTTINGGGIRISLADSDTQVVNASDVALRDLTVTGATGPGIHVEDNAAVTASDRYKVTLQNLKVHGNTTGVHFETGSASGRSGEVDVSDSVVADNTGAGVEAEACDADGDDDLTVKNTIIQGNAGGGITHHCGDLTVVNSTILENTGYGGIDIRSQDPSDSANLASSDIEIINGTIAENKSTKGQGAGIHIASPQGRAPTLKVTHSTIAGNDGGHDGIGGINSAVTSASHIEIVNTVVANNDGGQCDFAVAPDRNTANASSDTTCDGFAHFVEPDLQDPANNGGAAPVGPNGSGGNILTMAITTDSPLFDEADATACEGADARGVSRPQGSGCDIGAFEAETATITVDTTNGPDDDKKCALAEAVEAANTNTAVDACPGGSAGTDAIVIGVSGTIEAPLAGFVIESDLSIQGHKGGTTISGGLGVRILPSPTSSAPNHSVSAVTLADLAVTGARDAGVHVDDYSDASITGKYAVKLENLHLHGNRTGIRFDTRFASGRQGEVLVKDSLIAGNTRAGAHLDACTEGDEGAAGPNLEVTNSIIRDNAKRGSDIRGGLVNYCGWLKVTGSTVHRNNSVSGGGINIHAGRANPADTTQLASTRTEIVNTTIAGNRAARSGGGVNVAASTAGFEPSLTITHSTIAQNTAATGEAGGIRSPAASDLRIVNTVVADNTEDQCDLTAAPAVNTSNASSDSTCDGFAQGVTARLRELADNGGPRPVGRNGGSGNILTMAIAGAGPLLNAADAAACVAADARGVARPQGTGCDIGAYEARTGAITVDTLGGPAADGDCSLAEALQAANTDTEVDGCAAGAEVDTIDFALAGLINPPAGGFRVASNVTIAGHADGTTIRGNRRGFTIDLTATQPAVAVNATDVTLTDLTFTAARSGYGLQVLDDGDATVTDPYTVILRNLHVHDNTGGGILFDTEPGSSRPGAVLVEDTLINGNTDGSGIYMRACGKPAAGVSLEVNRSVISNNTRVGNGGGVANRCGRLRIEGSAIHDNSGGAGGGVYIHQGRYRDPSSNTDPASTRTEIVNTTITKNTATRTGGGVDVNSPAGASDFEPVLSITHGTIADNTAASRGGGLHSEISDPSDLSIANTVIADNTGSECSLADDPAVNTANASSDDTCGGFTQQDVTSGLRALAVNGAPAALGPNRSSGAVTTMAIPTTSPLHDKADTNACTAEDARGVARPQGEACDIGAYEATAAAPATITVNTLDGPAADGKCALAEAIDAANTDRAVDGCPAGRGADVISIEVAGTIASPPTRIYGNSYQITSDLQIRGNPGGTTIAGQTGFVISLTGTRYRPGETTPTKVARVSAVTLSNLTLEGRRYAAAIHIKDKGDKTTTARYTVTLRNLRIHNYATGVRLQKDFMSSRPGKVHITDSLIERNRSRGIDMSACDSGGGDVTVDVDNTIIRHNHGFRGAGIESTCGHLRVSNTTIHGNTARHDGGGIFVGPGYQHSSGTPASTRTEIVNSTITNNRAGESGISGWAAVYIRKRSIDGHNLRPSLKIEHSTITANSNPWGDAGGVGSRIARSDDISIVNTVIADNSGAECSFAAAPAVNTGNASSDGTCDDFAYQSVNPGLQPLDDNGGARPIGPNGTFGHIRTMAIDSTSPLRNRADRAACTVKDARGVTRPQGAGCDIGAYEAR